MTDLFVDGFESGNLSTWTGTYTNNGTVTVTSENPHHGTYSAKSVVSGGGGWAVVYRIFQDTTVAYGRTYCYVSAPATGTFTRIADFAKTGTPAVDDLLKMGIYNDSGTLKWRIIYRNNNSFYTVDINSPAPQANTWLCVEGMVDCSSSNGTYNGSYEVWVDGSSVWSVSNVDTDATVVNRFKVGRDNAAGTTYNDCVVVADTYIGPEQTTQTYTKTWTTDTLFKKLGLTKSFDVNVALQKQDIQKDFGVVVDFLKSDVPKSFTLDAFLKSLGITKTFDINTAIQKQDAQKSFGIDAGFLKSGVPKSFMLDMFLKNLGATENFAVDACFGALSAQTVSRQIDVLLKKLGAMQSFGLDSFFGAVSSQPYVKTVGLDVVFAYKVRLPELWLDQNGKLVLNISKPYAWVGV